MRLNFILRTLVSLQKTIEGGCKSSTKEPLALFMQDCFSRSFLCLLILRVKRDVVSWFVKNHFRDGYLFEANLIKPSYQLVSEYFGRKGFLAGHLSTSTSKGFDPAINSFPVVGPRHTGNDERGHIGPRRIFLSVAEKEEKFRCGKEAP